MNQTLLDKKRSLSGDELVDALSNFKIADKPPEAEFKRRGKFNRFVIALQNLHPEKAIEIPISYFNGENIDNWRVGLMSCGKRHGVKIGTVIKGRSLFAFKRSY